MKKKVGIIATGLNTSGVAIMLSNLSSYWDLERFDIYFFLAIDPGVKQFCEENVLKNGCHVIHLHDLDRMYLLKWPFTLRSALKRYGPFDAVHSNMNFLNGLNLWIAKREKIPVRIAHAHTTSDAAPSRLKDLFTACMKPLIAASATDKLACSEEAGKELFGEKPFEVMLNGIDIQKYLLAPSAVEKRKDQCVFAAVGRFSQEKNPVFLLRVFREIHRRIPDARLIWVGEGKLLQQVKDEAKASGLDEAIQFLGARRDVPDILKQCDYFLFPSLYEGLGNALVEAQASGLDCFASDTVPKVTDCGKVRFISLDLSAADWAEEIVAYIRSGQSMRLNMQRLEKFDLQEMSKKLMRIYDKSSKVEKTYEEEASERH